jgi:hypothetical protein
LWKFTTQQIAWRVFRVKNIFPDFKNSPASYKARAVPSCKFRSRRIGSGRISRFSFPVSNSFCRDPARRWLLSMPALSNKSLLSLEFLRIWNQLHIWSKFIYLPTYPCRYVHTLSISILMILVV